MALTIIGISHFSAEAQSKTKNAVNYKICLIGDVYRPCNEATPQAKPLGRKVVKEDPTTELRMMDTYTHLGYNTATASSARRNPRIRVSYDEPDAPYQGKESMVNDGQQKNKIRNINYLDGSVVLPANDGGLSNR